jgi:hypothetical protein
LDRCFSRFEGCLPVVRASVIDDAEDNDESVDEEGLRGFDSSKGPLDDIAIAGSNEGTIIGSF